MDEQNFKRCTKCGATKPITEFPRRNTGRPQCYCQPCFLVYYQEYYRENKAVYIARSIEYLKKIKQLLCSSKDKPCADCGQRYPYYVMDFDHRDGETKLFNVSSLNGHRRTSRKKLLAEIAKCDVVCANCHRERTYRRMKRAKGAESI